MQTMSPYKSTTLLEAIRALPGGILRVSSQPGQQERETARLLLGRSFPDDESGKKMLEVFWSFFMDMVDNGLVIKSRGQLELGPAGIRREPEVETVIIFAPART